MASIEAIVAKRKLKVSAQFLVSKCEMFGRNLAYLADFKDFETAKRRIEEILVCSAVKQYKPLPSSKFLVSRLEYQQIIDRSRYATYAIQLLTNEVALVEVKGNNLRQILRL